MQNIAAYETGRTRHKMLPSSCLIANTQALANFQDKHRAGMSMQICDSKPDWLKAAFGLYTQNVCWHRHKIMHQHGTGSCHAEQQSDDSTHCKAAVT